MLISARVAAERLGIKPATLYAYVSRGLVRSVSGPEGRERLYDEADVARLQRQRETGRKAGPPPKPFDTAAPVLDTSLCLIERGRLYYRGRDSLQLAETADLEAVAGLLWATGAPVSFAVGPLAGGLRRLLGRDRNRLPTAPIDRARLTIADLSMHDVGALDTSAGAAARAGARLVPALAAAVAGNLVDSASPLHLELAQAWKLEAEAADLVRRCLVLAADHELNASTYVARCIASTGASPYAVILGALGALSGPLHGGATSNAEAFLREALASGDVRGPVAARLQRGERVPGFGHPLYPDGDPRGAHIMAAVRASRYGRRAQKAIAVSRGVSELIGRHPNVDFALAMTSVVLGLPLGAGLGMFLVGRSVGWIAHAIEQYSTGHLIRPRARYVGLMPENTTLGDQAFCVAPASGEAELGLSCDAVGCHLPMPPQDQRSIPIRRHRQAPK